MIGPEEVKTKALRRFRDVCRQWISGENPYPLSLRVSLSPRGLNERDLFAGWKMLYDHSRDVIGFGYLVEFEEKRTRNRGVQSIARRIVIPGREDHLNLISKKKEFDDFRKDVSAIRSFLPDGGIPWCEKNVSLILRNRSLWGEIAEYVSYLKDNPELDYSPREVPVADSKFYEHHRPAVNSLALEALGKDFSEWVLNSLWRPTLRFLDPTLTVYGLSKITVELEELAGFLPPSIDRFKQVVILENRASFDSIPEISGTLAIWGEGNAVQALKGIDWLKSVPLFYWGDMDMDGLAILSRFRRSYPHVKSLAMGLEDFLVHEQFAVDAGSQTIPDKAFLTEEENKLSDELKDRSSLNRLEQERIPIDYLLNYLENLIK